MCEILDHDNICFDCESPHGYDVEHDEECKYEGGGKECTVFTEVSYTTYPCECDNELWADNFRFSNK